MGTPYLGEVKIVSFTFPPKGWAFCNGQLLPINQNQPLFALLGTTYGGNGQTTFGLPNLQGSAPIHQGNGFTLGAVGGEANHTLSLNELPTHTHTANAVPGAATSNSPASHAFATSSFSIYTTQAPNTTLIPATVSDAGASQPHQNMQPSLALNFVIALSGVFPSRN